MTTCMVAWYRTMRTPLNTSTERRAHFLSVVDVFHLHTYTHRGSSLSFSCHLHGHPCVRSLHLDPPFLPLALPSAPFPLPHLQEVHGKPAQLRQGGCGHHRRPLLLHREDRSGQPCQETGLFQASDHYYHEQ